MFNLILGFLSGIISGMGIGGGAILIPALILFQDVSQKLAQGTNLAYFIPTALISLCVHIKNKSVDLKVAFVIAVAGCISALGGSFLAMKLDADLLRRMFGFFLLGIGVYECFKGFRLKKDQQKNL